MSQNDMSVLDRYNQRFERSGTSLFIRTFLDNTTLVHEYECINVGQVVPREVQEIAQAIRTQLALGLVGGSAGDQVIDASADTPALKITQSGTGHALLVEDVASDTTPFVITQTGAVLLGSTTDDGVNKLQVNGTAKANGIKFPATQVASADVNTLDDYEEGTWTPTITGSTTAGTASYTTQAGSYVKIGKVVYITGRITWTAATGTGVMQISGLPFSNAQLTTIPFLPASLSATNVATVTGYLPTGTNIQCYRYSSGSAISVAVESSGDIIYSGFYFV